MRKVKNITVCVTPEIYREARHLAAQDKSVEESARKGPKVSILTTLAPNQFVFNRLRHPLSKANRPVITTLVKKGRGEGGGNRWYGPGT
jgi:hypothetical protein